MTRDRYSSNSNTIAMLVLVVLTAVATLYFSGLDRYGLFDVDEAIFAEASAEMLTTGNYVTPAYNGEPRYHKPPMIYWMQAVSMKYLDISPLSARLPSALLAFLTIICFYIILEGMTANGRFSLIASAVLGINLSFLILARAAVADMALIFFSLTASLLIMSNIFAIEKRIMPSIIAGFLIGAGLLSKGPIALMIPLVAVGCTVLFYGSFIHNLKRLNIFVTLLAIFITFIPWVKMIYDQHGLDFFNEFIFKHNLDRFLGGFGNSHSQSGMYYIWVLLIGFFPWAFILPSAIWQVINNFSGLFKSDKAEKVLPLIGLVWFITVVVFFSFSATKLAHYIVPALPGAAILIAWRLEQIKNTPLSKLNFVLILPISIALSGLFIVFKWLPSAATGEGKLMPYINLIAEKFDLTIPTITDPMLLSIISQNISIGIAPIIIGAILLIGTITGFIFLTNGHRQGIAILITSTFSAYLLLVLSVVPTIYAYAQQPLANIGEKIKENSTKDTKLFFVAMHQPSVRFISGKEFTPVDAPAQLRNEIFKKHNMLAVDMQHVKETMKFIPKRFKLKKSCNGGYCLIEADYNLKRRIH